MRGLLLIKRDKTIKGISSPQNSEEVKVNNEVNDYEVNENDPKSNSHKDDIEREPKITRSNLFDEKHLFAKKTKGNSSDLSVGEDGTDDEDEKRKI
ncbi:uncharacterized protein LOC112552822 [Pogonomyrmex barbatus]|uniref:Uncharacterized protein LOC112552822 n=1 Tax=Pogonomyrmex barbatus TaxID=144034 RepID=A0A8N1S7F5_9HYME|nr:uncharacterized protein LOC112552822 [Pogonomyrmex barbatus]